MVWTRFGLRLGILLTFFMLQGGAGCQLISGLDDLQAGSEDKNDTTSSSSGGGQGSGGFGGGNTTGGGGSVNGAGGTIANSCEQLDLSSQSPTLCSMDLGGAAQVSFLNLCNMGEVLELYWIPHETTMGVCGSLKYYATLSPGTSFAQGTFIGHRWRITEAGTGRVLKDMIDITEDGQQVTVP